MRPRASDFAAGDTLIADGAPITPQRIALAIIGGHATLPVRRRARVAIVATGDELVAAGESGGLPNSNGPMIAAMLAGGGATIVAEHVARDDMDALTALLGTLAKDADLIVTIGGASVGDHDLVRPALAAAGATIDFWRIAMRPGKPLLAGRLGGAVCLGLPGNPVSAFVTARLFLLPLVARLGGATDPLPRPVPATLGADLPAGGERAEYQRARMTDGRVVPVARRDSALTLLLADADALIVRAPHAPPARTGDPVMILHVA